MKPPRREATPLDQPVVVPDDNSATMPSRHAGEPAGAPPLHVRALDAFEAFYRQLSAVSQRTAALRAALDTDSSPLVVYGAADLNSALGVLYARLELLEVVTNDDAGRDLWTHPLMDLMRCQLGALLEDGAAYASRHPEDWRALQQLRQLAATLEAEATIATEIVGGAHTADGHAGQQRAGDIIRVYPGQGQHAAVVLALPELTRCRVRRPWRRRAWRRSRRLEQP